MHWYILIPDNSGNEFEITLISDNLLGIVTDLSFLFLISYYAMWRRLKPALTITFFITLFWSFSNILYSRFFHHYISLSAIGQGGTLLDAEMMRCVVEGLEWTDLYYVICPCIFLLLVKSVQPVKSPVVELLICMVITIGIDLGVYAAYCAYIPEYRYLSYYIQRIGNRQFSSKIYCFEPNTASFRRGCIRVLFHELLNDIGGVVQLSESQHEEIVNTIENSKNNLSEKHDSVKTKNIIFIIVESYMAFSSDMKIGGREVTPFLNSLKKDSTVYYNGMMRENVTIGESSDGQFIYMTGLLPLRSVITVSKARHITLPGLPRLLGIDSRMVIPTAVSIWNQDDMCRTYGFKHLYAKQDYSKDIHLNLNDEQAFALAMEKDKEASQPFFSVILTMSMHQPYIQQIDSTFIIKDQSIPSEMANYLNVCHYTDRQIERYFDHLKSSALYDNSLIVIAADHAVHNNTRFSEVSKSIPLYIVNIPYAIKDKMWKGECNQIDVFTTLLDILGIKCNWYGLGQSLLSPEYKNNINMKQWSISEWIIRSDYFSSHDDMADKHN